MENFEKSTPQVIDRSRAQKQDAPPPSQSINHLLDVLMMHIGETGIGVTRLGGSVDRIVGGNDPGPSCVEYDQPTHSLKSKLEAMIDRLSRCNNSLCIELKRLESLVIGDEY